MDTQVSEHPTKTAHMDDKTLLEMLQALTPEEWHLVALKIKELQELQELEDIYNNLNEEERADCLAHFRSIAKPKEAEDKGAFAEYKRERGSHAGQQESEKESES